MSPESGSSPTVIELAESGGNGVIRRFDAQQPTKPETWPPLVAVSEGFTMNQFDILMNFVRDTRDQQQKYLDTIRSENTTLIERYHNQSVDLVHRVESQLEKTGKSIRDELTVFKQETKTELSGVRAWYASTIITIVLTGLFGCGAIVLSIWLTAR